jgi:predicted ATPase
VTLTGPGGIGKTRLGVAAAARAAAAYPDGVAFVPLADIAHADQVESVLAETLGVRGEGARPLLETIQERLSADRVLLVVDNFEHVLEARSVVASILANCPATDVLVTSRTPLRLSGEYESPVPPLGVPPYGADPTTVRSSHSVQLFVERAQATQPGWTPSATDEAAIAEICRRLDGLPLAIELAASRLRILDPPSLLDRLGARLEVLGSGTSDLPERQRTLEATIGWSYDLLDDFDKILFARLSVFVGGWTVEAAEALCGLPNVLGRLEKLVEHSLVVTDRGALGSPRMRMLETIREYAATRLEESEEAEDVRRRHAGYYESLVHEVRGYGSARTAEALVRLDDDWDNIHALVSHWLESREYASLVQLASATWRYVWLYDRVREATAWMEEVYEVRDELEPSLRGELCRLWGSALYQFGEYASSRAALEEATELLAEHGPPDREAWARSILAALLPHFEPDLGVALSEVTRAAEIFREERSDFGLATSLGIMGTLTTLIGQLDDAEAQLDEGIAVAERLGLSSLIGANRTLRAFWSLATSDVPEARRYLEAAADVPLYLEGTAHCLEGFAAVAVAEGDVVRGALALGAAEGLRERTGLQMWPVVRMAFKPAIDALDAAGPEADEARYEGRRMSPRDALAELAKPPRAAAEAVSSS